MKSKIVALSRNEEFTYLLKKKKISNKYISIFFGKLSNKNTKKLNISFSVKKKIANAVGRNKVKRRLRSIFNDAVKQNLINLKNSYLVVSHSAMLKNDFKKYKRNNISRFKQNIIMKIINQIFIIPIKLYKFFLSPFFYNSCKFEPSCSSYCLECFEKYNFVKAIFKSTLRILRCNPWFGHGGHDPVEKKDGV